MAELDKGKTVGLKELIVSTRAMTDAMAKASHWERCHHWA